jgi:hypothetical protein
VLCILRVLTAARNQRFRRRSVSHRGESYVLCSCQCEEPNDIEVDI